MASMLNVNEILNRGSVVSLKVSAQPIDDARAQVRAAITAQVIGMMRTAVVRAIGATSDTDDIVNDAVCRMMHHADSFDWTKGEIHNWGCKIASNLARNWRKMSANNGHQSTEDDEEGETRDLCDLMVGADGRAEVLRVADAEALRAAIDSLSLDERRFIEDIESGMNQTAAGALRGWSPATAHRRMKAIAAKLAPLYY